MADRNCKGRGGTAATVTKTVSDNVEFLKVTYDFKTRPCSSGATDWHSPVIIYPQVAITV